jgi:hypothetical protein
MQSVKGDRPEMIEEFAHGGAEVNQPWRGRQAPPWSVAQRGGHDVLVATAGRELHRAEWRNAAHGLASYSALGGIGIGRQTRIRVDLEFGPFDWRVILMRGYETRSIYQCAIITRVLGQDEGIILQALRRSSHQSGIAPSDTSTYTSKFDRIPSGSGRSIPFSISDSSQFLACNTNSAQIKLMELFGVHCSNDCPKRRNGNLVVGHLDAL